MAESELIKELRGRHAYLEKLQKQSWRPHWREIQTNLLPERGFFHEHQQSDMLGQKMHRDIVTGVPAKAARNLAAMMKAGLTSPQKPWFKLRLANSELAERHAVRSYMARAEEILYAVFQGSNFYEATHDVYLEQVGFGTGCCFLMEDSEDLFRFYPQTVGTYWLAQNGRREIDTVHRRFPMTAKAIVETFGEDKVSDAVREAAKSSQAYRDFWITHAVYKRTGYDPAKVDNTNMPWASVYWEYKNGEQPLRVSGFKTKPFVAPRWYNNGIAPYGRGPGMDALSDANMLYEIAETALIAGHRQVDPPLRAPANYRDQLNNAPGAFNWMASQEPAHAIGPIYQPNYGIRDAMELWDRVIMGINQHFFADLFIYLMNRPGVTATEIAERHEEKLLLLGPVIERQMDEFLKPVIERCFSIINDRGLLPDPPPEIAGMEVEVEFVSILAQAQKLVGTGAINELAGYVAAIAAFDPGAALKFDAAQSIDVYARLLGVDPSIVKPDEVYNAELQQMQQQQQMAQGVEQFKGAAQGAKDLGGVSMEGGSMARYAADLMGMTPPEEAGNA